MIREYFTEIEHILHGDPSSLHPKLNCVYRCPSRRIIDVYMLTLHMIICVVVSRVILTSCKYSFLFLLTFLRSFFSKYEKKFHYALNTLLCHIKFSEFSIFQYKIFEVYLFPTFRNMFIFKIKTK